MTEINGSEKQVFVAFEVWTREPYYVSQVLLQFFAEELGIPTVRFTLAAGHIGCIVSSPDVTQSWENAERIIAAIQDYDHLSEELSMEILPKVLLIESSDAFVSWYNKFESEY